MLVNILHFGAVGDGKTLSTNAIQAAVDACSNAGGGTVFVPAGTYLIGTILLKSHITLQLESGAKLLGSPRIEDYIVNDTFPHNWWNASEQWCGAHMLVAVEQEDITIAGPGIVDGNCEVYFVPKDQGRPCGGMVWARGFRLSDHSKYELRPGQMIIFVKCRRVRVQNITLQNSPCWSCLLLGCEQANIHGVFIDNPVDAANSDGIDIDCCKRVTVSDCVITVGDDAITLRASGYRIPEHEEVCEDIAITNCVLDSSVCGFRIGVGGGIIRNATISNIAIRHAGEAVLVQSCYGKSKRCVSMYNINIDNIRGHHVAHPIRVIAGSDETHNAIIDNIRFSNFNVSCYGNISIIGGADCRPDRIVIRDSVFDIVRRDHPCSPEACPTTFVRCKQAERVTFRNCEVNWKDPEAEWKTFKQCEDVASLKIENCDFPEPVVAG